MRSNMDPMRCGPAWRCKQHLRQWLSPRGQDGQEAPSSVAATLLSVSSPSECLSAVAVSPLASKPKTSKPPFLSHHCCSSLFLLTTVLLLLQCHVMHASPTSPPPSSSALSSSSDSNTFVPEQAGDSSTSAESPPPGGGPLSSSESEKSASLLSGPQADDPATAAEDEGPAEGSPSLAGSERARLSKMTESDAPHLQALLRDLWHWRTQDSPEFATMVGLNDNTAGLLDSFTEEHFEERKSQCLEFLSRAEKLHEAALNFEDKVNLWMLKDYLNTFIDNYQYIRHYSPVSLLEGPHVSFPRLVQEQMVLSSYDDFQKLLSRYGSFPRRVQELIDILRRNVDQGAVPPPLVLEGVLERLASFAVSVTESEFFRPFVDLPPSITTLQRRTLRHQAQERVAQDVLPAYHSLHQYMQESYSPHAVTKSDGADEEGGPPIEEGLNRGEIFAAALRYHTGTSLSADQIHALGDTELRRVHPALAQAVVEAGLSPPASNSSLPQLMSLLREEPGRYFDSADELISSFEQALVAVAEQHTDDGAINMVPKTELRIRGSPVPPLPCRVLYEAASLDGGRRALITVDTSDLSLISRDEVTALSLGAGLPGRHLLSEFLRTSPGLPPHRRHLGDVRLSDAPAKFPVYSAFSGGWSLYGQFLGEELGMYPDPRQRLGRLSLEAVEAALLVVDSGLHHLGWSEDRARLYLGDNTPLSDGAIQNELRRVLTWPGLASAAKVGEIKLKELRQKAMNALGELFKLHDFHTVILKCAGPLNLLQLCVEHYIDAAAHTQQQRQEEEDRRLREEQEALAPDNVPPDLADGGSSSASSNTTSYCCRCSVQCLLLLLLWMTLPSRLL